MRSHEVPFLLTAVLAAFSLPAQAQSSCGPNRELLIETLDSQEKAVIARALTHAGNMIEVYAKADGEWLVVSTSPIGRVCIVVGGTNWQPVTPLVGEGI